MWNWTKLHPTEGFIPCVVIFVFSSKFHFVIVGLRTIYFVLCFCRLFESISSEGSGIVWLVSLATYHPSFGSVFWDSFIGTHRFSLAWWGYTFPMTGAATATIKYSNEVPNIVTKSLSVVLCVISTLTVTLLLGTTILHAFVLRDLFPNDIAIAISDKRQKTSRKWFHRRTVSSDKDIENYLKFAVSDGNDIEASLAPPSSITATSIQNSGTAGTHCNQSPSGPEP